MRQHVTRLAVWTVALGLAFSAPVVRADDKTEDKEAKRLEDSRQSFIELTQVKESIPRDLLEKARCVAVFPEVIKGAVGWGGRHGKGVMSCKMADGSWGPPIFLTITGGSFGLQIGVEKTELVLFFMNDKAASSLLESKFTLGGKGSVAAGPYGRSAEAETDLKLNAEIYSYAKSKGAFAGISLEGASLHPDNDALHRFYGTSATPRAVLLEGKAPKHPPAATRFTEVLPR
ncbi:MAG TPA: lipid-binding SYLF domain-containing protein [Candidatus Eisenbacteria bacterium]|nr:lipid-binding SYLF domain-containing protein [Candidatus Eisenbacteria bacterium]